MRGRWVAEVEQEALTIRFKRYAGIKIKKKERATCKRSSTNTPPTHQHKLSTVAILNIIL
jgi:hypothetical protein